MVLRIEKNALERNSAVLSKHGANHINDNVTSNHQPHLHQSHWKAYSLVLSVAVVSMKMLVVLPGTILEPAHHEYNVHLRSMM